MLEEWSTQRGRRVRVCAIVAMHAPNPGIHALWRFPCAFIHSYPFSTGQKEKVLARARLAVALT